MTDEGKGAPRENGRAGRKPGAAQNDDRLGNPTRLVPRQPRSAVPIEPEPVAEPVDLDPDLVPGATPGPFLAGDGPPPRTPFPGGATLGPMFAPRSFGGGRFQVFGCSPGCLVMSIVASLLLTFLLNVLF